ncbi:MAG: hypothetical protein K2X53_06375 [Alphaproteobacteria bacterium]|nr:hypothetical protein [Alphaproteobacteria bacterium]
MIKRDVKKILLATTFGAFLFYSNGLQASKRPFSEITDTTSEETEKTKKSKSSVLENPVLLMKSEKELRDGILFLLNDPEGQAQYKQVMSGVYQHVFESFKEKLASDEERLSTLASMRADFDQAVESGEISHNQFHYHTMQLMVLSNPDFKIDINFFESLKKFRSMPDAFLVIPGLPEGAKTPWKLSYAKGFEMAMTIESTLEGLKMTGMTEIDGTSIDELIEQAKEFTTNIYSISNRGLKVFPFFHAKPIFQLETYLKLFAEGAYLEAAPLAKCSVHSGLIEDPAMVEFHDVLHLNNMAPAKTLEENQVHMVKMRAVVSKLLQVFEQRKLSVEDRKKSIAALFAVVHELANYYEEKVLFNASMTDSDVFQGMMRIADMDVEKTFLGENVETKLDFYKANAAKVTSPETASVIVSVNDEGTHIAQEGEENAGAKYFKLEYFNEENIPLITVTTDDALSIFENARKFGYQIAWLLKYAGLRPDLTLENFKFNDGYKGFKELLGWFKETYEGVFNENNETASEKNVSQNEEIKKIEG